MLAIIQTDAATAARKFAPIIDAIEALKPQQAGDLRRRSTTAPTVPPNISTRCARSGMPYFPTPDRAFRALRADRCGRAAATVTTSTDQPIALPTLPHGGVIPEYRAKELLGPLGIPFPHGRLRHDRWPKRRRSPRALGYPVVIKAQAQRSATRAMPAA